jgi:hypothetical protein
LPTPVTTPLDDTVAIAILPELHVPEGVASVNVSVLPAVTFVDDEETAATVGKAVTVIEAVFVTDDPHELDAVSVYTPELVDAAVNIAGLIVDV